MGDSVVAHDGKHLTSTDAETRPKLFTTTSSAQWELTKVSSTRGTVNMDKRNSSKCHRNDTPFSCFTSNPCANELKIPKQWCAAVAVNKQPAIRKTSTCTFTFSDGDSEVCWSIEDTNEYDDSRSWRAGKSATSRSRVHLRQKSVKLFQNASMN